MDLLNFREPVAAWSHGAWLLLALPGGLLLWRRAHGDRGRQLVLLGYVASMALCAAASTVYHGVRLPDERLSPYLLYDHIGIYALIVGTYTPIAWTIMTGAWRFGTLICAWLGAGVGTVLHLAYDDLPCWVTTGLYLLLGWGAVVCFIELKRTVSRRDLRPITLGGVLYSVGAIFHTVGWPVVWPGLIGPHEVFHVFVVAGSAAHYQFMFRVVAPWGRAPVPSRIDANLGHSWSEAPACASLPGRRFSARPLPGPAARPAGGA